MYMVDKDEVVNSEFGFTKQRHGDIEKIYYDENDNNVVITIRN